MSRPCKSKVLVNSTEIDILFVASATSFKYGLGSTLNYINVILIKIFPLGDEYTSPNGRRQAGSASCWPGRTTIFSLREEADPVSCMARQTSVHDVYLAEGKPKGGPCYLYVVARQMPDPARQIPGQTTCNSLRGAFPGWKLPGHAGPASQSGETPCQGSYLPNLVHRLWGNNLNTKVNSNCRAGYVLDRQHNKYSNISMCAWLQSNVSVPILSRSRATLARQGIPGPVIPGAGPATARPGPASPGPGPVVSGAGPASPGPGPVISGVGPAITIAGAGPASPSPGPVISGAGPATPGPGPASTGPGPANTGPGPAIPGSLRPLRVDLSIYMYGHCNDGPAAGPVPGPARPCILTSNAYVFDDCLTIPGLARQRNLIKSTCPVCKSNVQSQGPSLVWHDNNHCWSSPGADRQCILVYGRLLFSNLDKCNHTHNKHKEREVLCIGSLTFLATLTMVARVLMLFPVHYVYSFKVGLKVVLASGLKTLHWCRDQDRSCRGCWETDTLPLVLNLFSEITCFHNGSYDPTARNEGECHQ